MQTKTNDRTTTLIIHKFTNCDDDVERLIAPCYSFLSFQYVTSLMREQIVTGRTCQSMQLPDALDQYDNKQNVIALKMHKQMVSDEWKLRCACKHHISATKSAQR